jgi:hypothetical protein
MDFFNKYMKTFERAVVQGVRDGLLGTLRPVPVTPGRLSRKRIGKALGRDIDSELPVVIDYYGFMKKSKGFHLSAKEVTEETGKQVKTIEAPVVHFNSLRLEVLGKINPDLIQQFGDFKKAILDAREFKHNYKV